ncbi:MAG: sialate O-acetylesterase [Clostridia bacterium]|nr:sialate O-acetylesterase [Clostridia bacterium]
MKKLSLILAVILLFSFAPPTFAADEYVSTADFTYHTFTPSSPLVHISFYITVNTTSDGIVGITGSSITPAAYTDYAICFRIREGGYFDSNDASSFSQVETAYYEVNTAYLVEIDADITNQIYNAYVTIDGTHYTVAQSYAFRTTVSDLGKITVRSGGSYKAGLYSVSSLSVTSEDGVLQTFTLPNYYSDNMVLQRGKDHIVFGRSTAETVTANLSGNGYTSSASAVPEDGEFTISLSPLPASLEPYTLTVSAADQTVSYSVYVGDVFLLAGQSNMAQNYNYQTSEQLGSGVTTSNLPTRISDDRIKHFTMNTTASSTPTFDVPLKNGTWQPLTEDNNKTLSYIGMFFAEERLNEEPDVPIGLISAAWNGTSINRWMRQSSDNQTLNYTPTNGDIFNSHIAPLTSYPICAILWYQGESDASNPVSYAEAFPTLIQDWRSLWNDDSLPFLFVQLARYSGQNYAPQREAQKSALELDNVGMAVILDTDQGTYGNIHPLGKETVAHRLFLLAEKYVYNKDLTAEGPLFESATIDGDSIIVSFRSDTIGDGLIINNPYGSTSETLSEFEVASADGDFVAATAVINPDNTITVSSPEVPNPAYVRYAYSAVPENPNLYNSGNLPASPFTTDTRIISADSFLTRAYDVDDADVQIAEFTMTAFEENIDGVVAFTDSSNTISAWSNPAVTIRFGTNGYLEYIDGASYKTSSFAYSANTPYEMRVLFDFTSNTYSVLVNVDDTWQILAEKASFRTSALSMSSASRLLVRGGDGADAGEFAVSDFTISAPEKNTVLTAQTAGSITYFIISPTSKAYAASYEDNTLLSVSSASQSSSIQSLTIPQASAQKLFFWNDNLTPQN